MKERSRTFNSIANSFYGIISALISVALNFVVRIVIIRALGEEINGLHNLFQSTINAMAVIETSIGSALIIHLYAPVKERDEARITALMSFYRRVYLVIALVFLLLGIIIDVFFINLIVHSSIPASSVRLYFGVFAASFFFNYLTYYKRSILFAEQRNRISMAATTVSEIVFRGLAVLFACLTKEYLYFLLFIVAEKLFGNLLCILSVNKRYPFLKKIRGNPIDKETKKSIYATMRPLFVNQFSSTIQTSANSIIISILLGNVAIVGYYGNYQLVVSTIQLIFSQFGSAFTTSFANLAVEKDKERMYETYRFFDYLACCVSIVCCAGFLSCVQSFIALCFGNGFLLSMGSVIAIVCSLAFYLFGVPVISVQNAMGLHKKDDILMVIQAVLAIAFGFIGGILWGMEGIVAGLTLPVLVFTLIFKGVIICREAFGVSARGYLPAMLAKMLLTAVVCAVSFFVCNLISVGGACDFIVKGVVSVAISCAMIALFTFRSKYFKKSIELIKRKRVSQTEKEKTKC